MRNHIEIIGRGKRFEKIDEFFKGGVEPIGPEWLETHRRLFHVIEHPPGKTVQKIEFGPNLGR